ncbi:MAG TPA: biotin--[acetyl-CoA-carboxylase] ligase [Verrucomicrobiae bacterium]|nr:biotin--[acetyl-CoA-carboxylase] ligase [Verrucomicrobiae bacterium]
MFYWPPKLLVCRTFAHNSSITKTQPIRRRLAGNAEIQSEKSQASDRRLGQIVRLLMEHATVVVSGTKVAQEISCSRSEVWRLIQQLRSLGVDVAGHPATGYQLRSVPDLLLPEILRPTLRGTIFESHLHHFYKIASTNSAAMAAAADGAPEGSVFLAEEQTAGRGRGLNSWQSPRSTGVYASIVLRPALPPSEVLVLSLGAGLAVRNAIEQLDSRVKPDLKWPNDILIDGRKVCGVLTEMNAEVTRVRYIVTGIGINVNQSSFPEELNATSLRLATGSEWSRVELVTALLKSLEREYKQLLNGTNTRDSVLRRFAQNSSWLVGKDVRIEENGSSFEGTTEGLDPRGFLRVRTVNGTRTVLSGTVRAR